MNSIAFKACTLPFFVIFTISVSICVVAFSLSLQGLSGHSLSYSYLVLYKHINLNRLNKKPN